MLGLLFKVATGIAPTPIQKLFDLRLASLDQHGFLGRPTNHDKQIMDPVAFNHPVIIKRSIFGLIRVFNGLPQSTVDAKTTRVFQKRLQSMAKAAVRNGREDWERMFHADC